MIPGIPQFVLFDHGGTDVNTCCVFRSGVAISDVTVKIEQVLNGDSVPSQPLEADFWSISMIIKTEERALVYKNDQLVGVLLPGQHFVSPLAKLEMHPVEKEFMPKASALVTVLAMPTIKDQLEVIEVPDNHIALHRQDGNLVSVLTTGKTAFWKGLVKHSFHLIDLDQTETTDQVERSILLHPALRDFVISYVVEPYQQGLLFIDKVFSRVLESGNWFFWKGSKSVNIEKVDLRQQQIEITGQEIMSRDKVPLRLNFFCQYRIIDTRKAAIEIKDLEKQFHVVLQLALREYVVSLPLDEILEKREEIGQFIAGMLRNHAFAFGLEIGYSGVKDVILPGEIRDIMNQVLIAEKKAQANVIMRREETASTRSLLNTAKLMEENVILYRLKELEYIERISSQVSQITLSGGNQIIDQLRSIFVPGKVEKN